MSILSQQLVTTGAVDAPTSFIYLQTNDLLSTVLVAGYLSAQLGTQVNELSIYQMAEVYTTDSGTVLLKVSFANGVWSLSEPAEVVNGLTFTGTLTAGNLISTSNASGIVQDSGVVATNVMHVNGINTMLAGSKILLDKGTGTEAANAVTINKQGGVITTSSLTTAGGSAYAITFTNSVIATTSTVNVFVMGGTNTTPVCVKATAGSSTSTITISNPTAATALNGTVLLGFEIW